ncbi:CRTAC1 family protein [Loktanella sp. SALINAS62]|uniref:CRTAC1 family protein n=1 Tax=Loktanella sp. SALINAS62 TaxID=2706124 RepID=UPI001B8A95D4|nr:CRTAC1 family protein [Loktanella sp. SALINAS62]MBS1300970.1 CRTAC1 family protein [Loktanella sp. SALINAS62]
MKWAVGLIMLASPAAAGPLFEDRSAALPAHSYEGGWEHFVGGGVAVMDCNADGAPDIFAAGGAAPARLIRNDGAFSFTDMPLIPLTGVTGAYPLDMDADGLTDLFVLRVGANVALRGGPDCTFTDATADWGIPPDDAWSTAFTAWWEPGDDRPTLAVGNYVDRSDPDGPFEACDDNVILRPDGDGYTATPLTPGYCPLSMLAARDARGQTALRLSNDRHYYISDGHEQMWDVATRRFLGPADGWDNVSLWGMGIASRDLTGDGRDEVMLTSMGDQVLHLAQPDGSYAAAPFAVGSTAHRPHTGGDGRPSTGWHAEFADVDNDGRSDLFIAKGNVDQMPGMAMQDPNNLLMQQSDGTFVEAAAAAGIATMERSRGAALADFDGDGRLDLLVANRRAPLELYRNVTPDTGHWLQVALQQSGGNRDAIGAVVSVTADGAHQSVQHVIGGGHGGGQLLARHFGLGNATQAQVTVTWPDGTTTTTQSAADHILSFTKP